MLAAGTLALGSSYPGSLQERFSCPGPCLALHDTPPPPFPRFPVSPAWLAPHHGPLCPAAAGPGPSGVLLLFCRRHLPSPPALHFSFVGPSSPCPSRSSIRTSLPPPHPTASPTAVPQVGPHSPRVPPSQHSPPVSRFFSSIKWSSKLLRGGSRGRGLHSFLPADMGFFLGPCHCLWCSTGRVSACFLCSAQ